MGKKKRVFFSEAKLVVLTLDKSIQDLLPIVYTRGFVRENNHITVKCWLKHDTPPPPKKNKVKLEQANH